MDGRFVVAPKWDQPPINRPFIKRTGCVMKPECRMKRPIQETYSSSSICDESTHARCSSDHAVQFRTHARCSSDHAVQSSDTRTYFVGGRGGHHSSISAAPIAVSAATAVPAVHWPAASIISAHRILRICAGVSSGDGASDSGFARISSSPVLATARFQLSPLAAAPPAAAASILVLGRFVLAELDRAVRRGAGEHDVPEAADAARDRARRAGGLQRGARRARWRAIPSSRRSSPKIR